MPVCFCHLTAVGKKCHSSIISIKQGCYKKWWRYSDFSTCLFPQWRPFWTLTVFQTSTLAIFPQQPNTLMSCVYLLEYTPLQVWKPGGWQWFWKCVFSHRHHQQWTLHLDQPHQHVQQPGPAHTHFQCSTLHSSLHLSHYPDQLMLHTCLPLAEIPSGPGPMRVSISCLPSLV